MTKVNENTETSVNESFHIDQMEKGRIDEKNEESVSSVQVQPELRKSKFTRFQVRAIISTILMIVTAFFIASLIIRPDDSYLRIAIYTFITLKLFFKIIPVKFITSPIKAALQPIYWTVSRISKPIKGIIGIGLTLITIIVVTFASPVTKNGTILQRSQSLLGLFTLISIMMITSHKFRKINWHAVIMGILLQVLLGIFIFKTEFGVNLFQRISDLFLTLTAYSAQGSEFVFGDMAKTPNFAFAVLPAILFFASFIEILYYVGAMSWLIMKFARFFKFFMNISGCESVNAAASPFLGQCESPMLIKPFIADMTSAELHQVMTSGASTIAGSVMIAYLNLGINPQALITSCVMSIPCSLALSKLRYPEEEESKIIDSVQVAQRDEPPSNILHAATNGAIQGVQLCLIVTGILLAVVSLMGLLDGVLVWIGGCLGFEGLTFKFITGYVFRPFAWLVGVPWSETKTVGQLIAVKMFVNEFAAFIELSKSETQLLLSSRTQILSTFVLCGFANFASMGLQIGTLGAMAPSRKADISRVALSSMLTGTICTFISATIAGLLI